jgi:DNA-binding Lrp family transcriptional regulator
LPEKSKPLDELDTRILGILQSDCRIPLGKIARELGVPKSTVHYRVKRLEADGVIKGYRAKLDAAKLGKDYVTLTFIRAKYGPSYHDKVGKALAKIPGTSAVYFVFGETDFIALIKSKNRDDFMKKLENMTNMQEIERTHTQIVAKAIKEDMRVDL